MSLTNSLNSVSHQFGAMLGKVPSLVWIVLMLALDAAIIVALMGQCSSRNAADIDESVFISPDTKLPENEYMPYKPEVEEMKPIQETAETPIEDLLTPEMVDETDGDLISEDDPEIIEPETISESDPLIETTTESTDEPEEVF